MPEMTKKYSELTLKEFIHTPLEELARMEQVEFPERCAEIAAYYLTQIHGIIGWDRWDNKIND